ncbi:MAG: response regulator [Cellulosilyticaceae bacterium]
MFKLIIVDDEDIILNGLSKYINWHALNFHVVGTAHSMTEALALLSQHSVDVVLTDIRMESESGLDLIAHIALDYPHIKTVILSGYEEFDYARRALQYGTFDFLTKPVNFDALYATFNRLAASLQDHLDSHEESETLIALKRSTFLNNLIREATLLDPHTATALGIPLTASRIQTARLRLEPMAPEQLSQAQVLLKQLLDQTFAEESCSLSFHSTLTETTLLAYHMSEDSLIVKLERCMSQLQLPLTIGLSKTFTHLQTLHTSYFQAGKALDYKIIKKNSHIIPFREIENIFYRDDVMTVELRDRLLNSLLLKDMALLATLVTEEIQHIAHHSDNLNLTYSFCMEFYLLIHHFLKVHHSEQPLEAIHHWIRQLMCHEKTQDIIAYTHAYIDRYTPSLLEVNADTADSIKTAQHYIQEHYAENLTLNTLSDILFIHPIYFSKLFKEKTGQNFIDYLTSVRIEKAKLLLADTHFKIYDISEMVGYESPKYFSKLFKEIVGTTPKCYRYDHTSLS